MEQWAITGVIAVLVGVVGFFGGREVHRRATREASTSADEMVGQARLEAQRILSRGEEEARATAQAYREREEAALEHRKVEVSALEERLTQREATLEQRAANLALREDHLVDKERVLGDARSEVDTQREEARNALQRVAGFDAKAAKDELLRKVEDEARREAMVLVRDIELHHREGRAQHPHLRSRHRRQPHRRRHTRGGVGVDLRPGAPRGGPPDPGAPRGRRSDPSRIDRGGPREGQGRGGAEHPRRR
jgi:hypothetical protein